MENVNDELDDEVRKGLRIRSFFEIEARGLQERYKVIETLLPNQFTRGAAHRGEEGRFIEALLRSFLNKHLPNNLRAVSGFILCPAVKLGRSDNQRVNNFSDRHSRQIDIIIYDFDSYPVYERFEDFCIVPPEGVVGLVSVKKRMYTRVIREELNSLRDAAILCAHRDRRGPFTSVFGFTSDEDDQAKLNQKIFDGVVGAYADQGDFDSMVNEVTVMGQTCVFKVRPGDSPAHKARYVSIDCSSETHIPLQRMIQSILSVYYDPSRGSPRERPGFVSFRKSTFRNSPVLGDISYQMLRPYSEVKNSDRNHSEPV